MSSISIENWQFGFSSTKEILTESAIEQSINTLKQWAGCFPKENSWVEKNYGIPSLIVRLDCTANGSVSIYEIEERPSGIGIACRLNPDFEPKLRLLKNKWPDFKSLVSPKRVACDDNLWLDSISLEESLKEEGLLLIRAEPEEVEYISLQNRSISSLENKGDKSYGVKMGLWKTVSLDDFDSLPWTEGFCLKPIKGSKCRGIHIWNPKLKKTGGLSSKSQMRRALEEYKTMYLQEYIPPIEENGLFKIFRIFFGYDPDIKEYVYLGGLSNARPNLRIHGATDMVAGVIN